MSNASYDAPAEYLVVRPLLLNSLRSGIESSLIKAVVYFVQSLHQQISLRALSIAEQISLKKCLSAISIKPNQMLKMHNPRDKVWPPHGERTG